MSNPSGYPYRRQQDASPVRGRASSEQIGPHQTWPFVTPTSLVGFVALALSLLGIIAFILVFVWHYQASVWSLNTLTTNVEVLGGVGITATTNTALNTITLAATGLLSDVAGPGLSINTTSGVTTITHVISYDTLNLVESDPNGAQVAYGVNINTADGAWQVTTTAVFPGTFIPGLVAGDGGQGNVNGTAWVAPANGVYAFNADCRVAPSAYVPNDYQSATIALSLNATGVNPLTGVVPPGGLSSLSLSVGTNGAQGPAFASHVAVSATVHVCPTCLVQVGAPLHLHARLDHTGAAGPPQATTAGYGILAGTTVTTVGATTVNGNLGLNPGSSVTGAFTVTGATNVDNAAAIQAQADLTALYNNLAALPCTQILQGTDLAGLTLTPGVYCYTSSGTFGTGTLTLNGQGNPGALFVFKYGTTLTTSASAVVAYTNGAQACGTFWQIGSSATFGATQTFGGTVVALTSISVGAGASTFAGGLLARNGATTFSGANVAVTAQTSCVAPLPVTAAFACALQVSREV